MKNNITPEPVGFAKYVVSFLIAVCLVLMIVGIITVASILIGGIS